MPSDAFQEFFHRKLPVPALRKMYGDHGRARDHAPSLSDLLFCVGYSSSARADRAADPSSAACGRRSGSEVHLVRVHELPAHGDRDIVGLCRDDADPYGDRVPSEEIALKKKKRSRTLGDKCFCKRIWTLIRTLFRKNTEKGNFLQNCFCFLQVGFSGAGRCYSQITKCVHILNGGNFMEKTTSKKWLSLLMALLVIISCTSLVMAAGLTKGSDGKWHYVLSNGNYAKNTWMTVSGSKYYFDGNGNGVTGFYTVSGKKYYFDTSSAKMQKNCWKKNSSGKWLYFGSVGEAVNGWLTLNSTKYYFENYFMVTGWKKLGGANYHFDSNGRMETNRWLDGHYLGSNGKALTGWQTLNGYRYFFDGNGKMYTGLKNVGSYKYYFDTSNGRMLKNAWKSINGNYYYFNGNGEAVKGWQTISGATYYFNENYVRLSGTQTIDGMVSHLDSDGKAITGWQTIDGKTYYYDSHGVAVTDWKTIDGDRYFFGNDGGMRTDWFVYNGYTYYFGKDGKMATGPKGCNDGYLHYFNADGHMLRNGYVVEHRDPFDYIYVLDEEGRVIEDGYISERDLIERGYKEATD